MERYKSYYTRFKNDFESTVSSAFWVIAVVGFVAVGYIIVSFISNKYSEAIIPKTWTLFIYDNPIPDTEKQDIRIDGYNSKATCLEKGVLLTKLGQSFECGLDCKYKEGNYYFEVCEVVCSKSNCH